MDAPFKECPSCKRQILADALFCSYCGAQFTITYQGYCANCHTVRSLNALNRCAACGGDVVDPQPVSQVSGFNVHSLGRAAPAHPSQAGKKGGAGCLGQVRGCLVLIVVGLSILLAAYYLSDDFRQKIQSLGDIDIPIPEPAEKTEISSVQTLTPAVLVPTSTPRPTSTQVINLPNIPPNTVCVGGFDDGLTCLHDGAWTSASRNQLPYTGHLSAIAACPGETYLLVSDVFYGFSDGKWTKYGQYGGTSTGVIGCGVRDDVWIFDVEAAYHFEDGQWTEFVYETVLDGVGYLSVKAVKITQNNQVWAVSNENVVHFDGAVWTVFENKKDLLTDYRLTGLAVDQKGIPWVTFADGLASYDGTVWKKTAPPAASDVNTVFIDSMDQLWVGTDGGVSMAQNGGWQRYPIGKTAGRVHHLSMDSQGRMWVGTDWGLGVLENGKYTFYHMSNSDLLMNDIDSLIVIGDGPELPQKVEKEPGSMEGKLMNGAAPLGNARVEICVQSIKMFFSGATPCSEQPYKAVTTSDAQGQFTIENLPVGYYIVTIQAPDGKWKVRSNTIGVGSVYIPVLPGEITHLGELDISED